MRSVGTYYASPGGLRGLSTGTVYTPPAEPGGGGGTGETLYSYAAVTDRFEGALSSYWAQTFGSVSTTGGSLDIVADAAYPGVSTAALPFTGRAVRFRVSSVPAEAGTESVFQVRFDASNHVGVSIGTVTAGSTRIYLRRTVGGVTTQTDVVAYNSTAHAWLQLREDAGTWRLEASSTGGPEVAAWSSLGSVTVPFSAASLSFRITAGVFANPAPATVGRLRVGAVNASSDRGVGLLPRLAVSGGKVVTETGGAAVLLRGANIRRAEYNITQPMDWSWDRRSVPLLASDWGANVVMYGFAVNPVNAGDTSYLDDGLDQAVQITREANVYLVLAARTNNRSEVGDPQFVGVPPVSAEDALAVLARRYRDETHVMYAAQVEMNGTVNGVNYSDTTSVTAWTNLRDYTERCVDKIRAAAAPYKPIVFTSGLHFGRYINRATTLPVRRDNIVYKTHVYEPAAEFQGNFGAAVDAGLPVWIGEFGPWAGGMTVGDCQTLLDYAAEKQLGWAAWLSDYEHSPIWADSAPTGPAAGFGQLVFERTSGKTGPAPPPPSSVTTLWQPNLAEGTPAFRAAAVYIGGGSTASYPTVSGTTDPSGRELHIRIPSGVSHAGVQFRTRFSDIPLANRDDVYFSHELYVPSGTGPFGGTTTKLFNGVFGLPSGAGINTVAGGGANTTDRWSVRFVSLPANYRSNKYGSHPVCLGAYIYASVADGVTQAQDTNGYGIEVAFRSNATGAVVALAANTWLKLEGYVKVGSTDNRDGSCRMWLNGALVVDVNDITWTGAPGRLPITGWWQETFHNKGTPEVTYRVRNFRLTTGRRWL